MCSPSTPEELRHAVDQIPDLGEILVKAFIMRRELVGRQWDGGGHHHRLALPSRVAPAPGLRHPQPDPVQVAGPGVRRPGRSDPAGALKASATPIVLGREGQFYSKPPLEFACCAGLTVSLSEEHVRDVIVVGAGPAGLAASVYAASEGPRSRPSAGRRGQAGTSSRIENYLGFPPGHLGAEFARNALVQAQRFGARVTAPCRVRSLGLDGGDRIVTLMDGTRLRSRCVLV